MPKYDKLQEDLLAENFAEIDAEFSQPTIYEIYADVYEKNPLIREHNIVIAPTHIDGETYRELMVALYIARRTHPAKEIYLYLNGYGGETDLTLAVITHIKRDKNVVGVVSGGSNSAHTLLFAACPTRYISEYAMFGFHGISHYIMEDTYGKRRYTQNASNFEAYDKTAAALLGSACSVESYDYGYWMTIFEEIQPPDVLNVSGQDAISEYGLGVLLPESLPVPIM